MLSQYSLTSMPRGRSSGSGLVVLSRVVGSAVPAVVALASVVLSGCDPGRPPPGAPVADYREPSLSERGDWTLIESPDPAKHLLVYGDPPADGLQLLFMGGRAATPLRNGGAAWPDESGARILVFDERGVVARVAQGALPDARNLTRPVSVAVDGGSLLAIEADGQGLRFGDDGPEEWVSYGVEAPAFGGGVGAMVAARSIFEFHMAPARPRDPLLWIRDGDTREMMPLGSPAAAPDPFLGQLVNTGWTVATDDGLVVFASALRRELVAFDSRGDTTWVSLWQPADSVAPPSLDVVDGSMTPVFSVIQFGMVTGPDGLIYVLAATEPGGPPDKVLVFDREGRFVRSGRVSENDAIFADARGRIYGVPIEDALSRTGEPERAVFPAFDLPLLGGIGRTTLEAHRGKVVVLNFWASWCGPCRREMPLLATFANELDPDQAVLIGLIEDLDPEDALAFLEEIGGVGYPHGQGRGRLRNRYNYRGLPYTVVLDRDLRVIRGFYGFGSSIDPIEKTVERELSADH